MRGLRGVRDARTRRIRLSECHHRHWMQSSCVTHTHTHTHTHIRAMQIMSRKFYVRMRMHGARRTVRGLLRRDLQTLRVRVCVCVCVA